jgi:hypothetical protein
MTQVNFPSGGCALMTNLWLSSDDSHVMTT